MELSKSIYPTLLLLFLLLLLLYSWCACHCLIEKSREKNHIFCYCGNGRNIWKNSLVYFFSIFQNFLLRICGMECITNLLVLYAANINTYSEWQNEEFSLIFSSSKALHSTSHKMPFENISVLNATTGNEIENLMRISEIDKSLNYFSRSFFHSLFRSLARCLIWESLKLYLMQLWALNIATAVANWIFMKWIPQKF